MLGNAKHLPISHTGHTSLSTHYRSLSLDNIRDVLQLRNSLISVAKLSRYNNVSVEFFSYHFVVKDVRTTTHLMRGINVNDVYYAAINSFHYFSQINPTKHSTGPLLLWHHKFGHPSIKVLKLFVTPHFYYFRR